MTGLAVALMIAAGAFGPDGFAVHRRLLAEPAAAALPVARLLAAADDSWVVWHYQRSWAAAFYSPPGDDLRRMALAALAAGRAGATVERLLPGLEVPRIFLYAPTYRPGGAPAALSEPAVDVAEIYFRALVELALDRQLRQPGSWFRQLAQERAAVLMDDVPAAGRRQAYADAVAAFTAHLLSIAHEIARAAHRAEARGEDLCGLLDPPRTLFALWRQSVRSTAYRGRYLPASDRGDVPPVVAESRRGLASEDKEQILAELLQGRWTGDPVRDFAPALCPQVAGDRP
jgi:hypothetical protein